METIQNAVHQKAMKTVFLYHPLCLLKMHFVVVVVVVVYPGWLHVLYILFCLVFVCYILSKNNYQQ